MAYVYEQSFADEQERLAGMEQLWDAGTFGILAELGVGPGWRCAEVGAGGGSVAEHLSTLVGARGHVVATDVDTQFVAHLDRDNLEIRVHDITTEPLPAGHDLVHARLLLEHLGPGVLDNMLAGLRPGGTLLVEDYDWIAMAVEPPDAEVDMVSEAVIGFMASAGFDPFCGRRLHGYLTTAGLADVEARSRGHVVRGASPMDAFFRLSLQSLAPALIAAGILDEGQVERTLARFADPHTTMLTPVMVAAWGRLPG